ncbi:hypothetical protein LZZ85_28155 [Terrimonas sp. NA20]|uniref:Sel1 repeat family protein n=1 Tax=Terrimonas ginsenosidimutans TaxID=2908004 RepID=A0ABS9L0R4_9BACT|nr:hypothetical protein [Terrimonas ginsenosidimutans]MCG2618201.1 hypothetical protein [Terrimonas ginsenosidimutans]
MISKEFPKIEVVAADGYVIHGYKNGEAHVLGVSNHKNDVGFITLKETCRFQKHQYLCSSMGRKSNKMKNKLITLALISLLICQLSSCEEKSALSAETVKADDSFPKIDTMYEVLDRALEKGDKKAYNKVSNYFFMRDKYEDFLYAAIIMANKYQSPEAHLDVYKILNGTRSQGKLSNLDSNSKRLAVYYLLRSYELGLDNSKIIVNQLFKDSVAFPKSGQYR